MILRLFIFFIIIHPQAWAQKSKELDQQKAESSKLNCLNWLAWEIIADPDGSLNIDCRNDYLHFYTQTKIDANNKPVRIGAYNLLHPGMEKTIFKDMTLTAQIIDQNFDVMAAIELIDVLGNARSDNQRLLTFIEENLNPYQTLKNEFSQLKLEILKLETQSKTPSEIEEINQLNSKLQSMQNHARYLALEHEKFSHQLKQAQSEVDLYSEPILSIFGFEIFKKWRLKKLDHALLQYEFISNQAEDTKIEMIQNWAQIKKIETRLATLNQNTLNEEQLEKIQQSNQQLGQTQAQMLEAKAKLNYYTHHYRLPGYLDILVELRKINPNWSLIVSPHGDAAQETHTQELVGFYYRADKVKPTQNLHCSNQFQNPSYACYPNLYEDYMGEDYANLFSRRPFIATFNAGKEDFSLLGAHVIFTSPRDSFIQSSMLSRLFKFNSPQALGTGINQDNYARFVEVKASLELKNKLKEEGLKNIIYLGDFNLESRNPFWQEMMKDYPDLITLIDTPTSLTEIKTQASNQPTLGLSNNYDHFIMENDVFEKNCHDAKVIDFINGPFAQQINQKYLIRTFIPDQNSYQKINQASAIKSYRQNDLENWSQRFRFSLSRSGIITPHNTNIKKDKSQLIQRVFDSQLSERTYYRYFIQTMSDHLPIKLKCHF
jgi:hypothetical protein